MEKTTAFGNGSLSKGDPAGGGPIALTSWISPGWITGDLCRLRGWKGRVRGISIPSDHHVTFEVLQFLCLMIEDASEHFVGLKPSVNVGNAD